MLKLSDGSRRVLRRIYQGLGVATVSLLFQACYGTPPYKEVAINGTVSSKSNIPIPGIKVSVEYLAPERFTDKDGVFNFYVPEQDLYELQFEDVDGDENGSYKTLKKTVKYNDAKGVNLQIQLDETDEE